MPRTIAISILAICLPALAIGPAHAEGLDLEALVAEALANNPNLAALRHQTEAFQARVPQAGALNDPMFKVEASNLPLDGFDYSSSPMSGNQFMLSQMLPFPGVLAAREQSARHAASAAGLNALDRELAVANRVKQAFYQLAFVDQAIRVTLENEMLMKDFVKIAQTKYALGRGLQQDVLKAQVSLSALRSRLIELRRMRKTGEANLNLVLNRASTAPVGHPEEVALRPVEASLEKVQELALANRPVLEAVEQGVQQWVAAEEAARKGLWPTLTLNLGYRQRSNRLMDPVQGSDFLSFGVGMNLPIFQGRKQRQMIVEFRSNRSRAEAGREATRQQILAQVRIIYDRIAQHAGQAELFRTAILPQSQQSLRSARSGYQVDKVDFLTLLNNQVTLLNHEIAYYGHVTEHERQVAQLEAATGTSLH